MYLVTSQYLTQRMDVEQQKRVPTTLVINVSFLEKLQQAEGGHLVLLRPNLARVMAPYRRGAAGKAAAAASCMAAQMHEVAFGGTVSAGGWWC